MKEVSIPYLHEQLHVASDGRLFWRVAKKRRILSKEAGSDHNAGYRHIYLDGRHYLSHRIVFAMTHGFWPPNDIDHMDGDRKNNKPSNLRLANRSENLMNMQTPKTNSSGVKGVAWDKNNNKWRAAIQVNGKTVNLGRFVNISDAANAYGQASAKYHGEYGRVE